MYAISRVWDGHRWFFHIPRDDQKFMPVLNQSHWTMNPDRAYYVGTMARAMAVAEEYDVAEMGRFLEAGVEIAEVEVQL